MGTEVPSEVYGTLNETDSRVMSERVQSLAGSIYKEFEHMIAKYDEDVVKELMPLVVGILEALDTSYSEKQENEVELELVKEDNQQLLAQYDREKQLRRTSEQKLLEIEDALEEDRKKTDAKIESLESLVRMLELKSKNASDHVGRLEEKEGEMKKEYGKLHDRYTELFKTHMEYLERTKSVLTNEKDLAGSPRGKGFVMPALRPVHVHHQTVHLTETLQSTPHVPGNVVPAPVMEGTNLNTELQVPEEKQEGTETKGEPVSEQARDAKAQSDNAQVSEVNRKTPDSDRKTPELDRKTSDSDRKTPELDRKDSVDSQDFDVSRISPRRGATDDDLRKTMADIVETTPELEEFDDNSYGSSIGMPRHSIARRGRAMPESDSLFDELQGSEGLGDVDEGADLSAIMGKEFDNLIQENAELLATKNALNIVKDDLIAQVDELNSEVEMVKGELRSLRALCDRYKERIGELEEQVKKQKEDFETRKSQGEDDEDIPRAQRKRFTRVEMARVLMERNQYKERLMELQEAVRWTEMIRASREHPELAGTAQEKPKKSGMWNFFGNLFGDGGSSSGGGGGGGDEASKSSEGKSSTKWWTGGDASKTTEGGTSTKAKYSKGPGLPKQM